MRRAAPLLLVLAAAASCKGGPGTLQDLVDRVGAQFDTALGAKTLPGKHVAAIYALHEEDGSWRFRAGEDDALERCCESVRTLAAAEYASWREAAVVVGVLSELSELHPSALVRTEAIDALTRMSSWTAAAVAEPPRRTTEPEMVAALGALSDLRRRAESDPSAVQGLADALNVVAAYRFDRSDPLPAKPSRSLLARGSRAQFLLARRTLVALTGGALEGFDADPRVRDSLDRALVGTSASAIRLAVVAAATGGPTEIVRAAAVRDLAVVQPEQAARMLGAVLRDDDASAVRREAARSLQAFPEAQSVPELLDGLADDRIEVRATAAASLAAVTGESHGDDRGAWIRWWQGRGGAPPAR